MGVQTMKIVPIQLDAAGITRYSKLLKTCFPGTPLNAGKFSEASLIWLYIRNPEGMAIGFDAFDDGQLAAHYVCIPTTITGTTGPVKALLSLNTATAPQYQGKGLFTQLARSTFDFAKQKGFVCVYGVANQNSTTGFVQKLGFDLVAPLEARIGIGRIQPPKPNSSFQFQRSWNTAALNWRCANPANPIRTWQHASSSVFLANTGYPLIAAYDERWETVFATIPLGTHQLKLKLILGLFPQGIPSTYFRIPNILKPSPLNFIFKSLDPAVTTPEHPAVHFTFLDFDAY
jgi:GNAT superfamily N-acetyltransferase